MITIASVSRRLCAPALFAVLLLGCRALPRVPIPDPAPLARITAGQTRREAKVMGLERNIPVTIGDLQGPGVIRHIWFTVRSDHPRPYAGLVLRIWWDGEPLPSVEVPLGDLFGVGFGEERLVSSAAVEMIPAGLPGHAALNCWIPMPFETARITIENQNPYAIDQIFWIVDWECLPSLDDGVGRFHAQWRRSNPVARGRPHTVLTTHGEGQFIGLIYSIRRLGPGAWVEGGEDFYIDVSGDEWAALKAWDFKRVPLRAGRLASGEINIANQPMGPVWPTLPGIGGEDYFGQSWGYKSDASMPLHGVTLGPDDDQRMTAYRFHLPDPVRFHRNLWMVFRDRGYDVGNRADDITTVALWYQREPHDRFPPLPVLGDRIPPPPLDMRGVVTDVSGEHIDEEPSRPEKAPGEN
jgi:hypothetical protein